MNFTRTDAVPISLRRSGTAGNLIEFYHDSTTVGKIGIQSSGFYIDGESGHEGIRFANGAITPRENGSDSDGASDLGASGNQFKDGYFTGTVFAEAFTGRADTDTAIQMTGSNVIKFFTNSSERMRLDQDGKLLLGTTSTIAGAHISHLYDSNNGSGLTMSSTDSSGNTHNQVIFIRNGSTVGVISTNSSNTTFGTSSDRRLKSNIQDAASASAKIDAMKVRQFDWNVDGSHQDFGLVAQELQPIAPTAVLGDAGSDEMMSVDYSKLVPMLLKEIQELRSRVATLEAS